MGKVMMVKFREDITLFSSLILPKMSTIRGRDKKVLFGVPSKRIISSANPRHNFR